MSRKNGKRSRHASGTSLFGVTFWLLFLPPALALTVFYVGGRIQIDQWMREVEALRYRVSVCTEQADDLAIRIDQLERYERIVSLARDQGLVFLSHQNIAELEVDFSGLPLAWTIDPRDLTVAGGAASRILP